LTQELGAGWNRQSAQAAGSTFASEPARDSVERFVRNLLMRVATPMKELRQRLARLHILQKALNEHGLANPSFSAHQE
jgi:hypothetical protein